MKHILNTVFIFACTVGILEISHLNSFADDRQRKRGDSNDFILVDRDSYKVGANLFLSDIAQAKFEVLNFIAEYNRQMGFEAFEDQIAQSAGKTIRSIDDTLDAILSRNGSPTDRKFYLSDYFAKSRFSKFVPNPTFIEKLQRGAAKGLGILSRKGPAFRNEIISFMGTLYYDAPESRDAIVYLLGALPHYENGTYATTGRNSIVSLTTSGLVFGYMAVSLIEWGGGPRGIYKKLPDHIYSLPRYGSTVWKEGLGLLVRIGKATQKGWNEKNARWLFNYGAAMPFNAGKKLLAGSKSALSNAWKYRFGFSRDGAGQAAKAVAGAGAVVAQFGARTAVAGSKAFYETIRKGGIGAALGFGAALNEVTAEVNIDPADMLEAAQILAIDDLMMMSDNLLSKVIAFNKRYTQKDGKSLDTKLAEKDKARFNSDLATLEADFNKISIQLAHFGRDEVVAAMNPILASKRSSLDITASMLHNHRALLDVRKMTKANRMDEAFKQSTVLWEKLRVKEQRWRKEQITSISLGHLQILVGDLANSLSLAKTISEAI